MARATYLSCISELPQWGAHCFPVKQDSISEIPRRIICAVRRDAVLLLQRKTFQQFDLFGLNEFARWGFDPGRSFHFILKDDEGEADEETGMFIFFSKEGERFAHTLSKFAELWMLNEVSGDSQPEPHQHLAHEQQRLAPEQLLHGLGIRHRVVDGVLRALSLAAEPGQSRRMRVVRREGLVLCSRDLARRRILVKPAARCTVGRVGLLLYRAHIAIGAKSTQRAAL